VDDAKKSRDDRDAVVQGKAVRNRPLGDAIESDDEQGDQEMIFTHDPEKFFFPYKLIAFVKVTVTPRHFL
jgi:hypothetical protein